MAPEATSLNAFFALLFFADVKTEAHREDLAHGRSQSKSDLKNQAQSLASQPKETSTEY